VKAPEFLRAARRSQNGGFLCFFAYAVLSESTEGRGPIPKAVLGVAVLVVYFAAWWLADKVARPQGVSVR
jgi:hypothetical protein